jgi:hypothetical protein
VNDFSNDTSADAVVERWPEMVSLIGSLALRAVAISIAAGSLFLLSAAVLI